VSGNKKRKRQSKPKRTIPSSVSIDAVATALTSEHDGEFDLPSEELARFADAISARHENILRLRPEIERDAHHWISETKANHVDWYPLAIAPPSTMPRPSRTIDYAAGEYYLQDAGSLLALAAAEADTDSLRGQLICDLCAAPGGKASGLLEAITEPAPTIPSGVLDRNAKPRGFLLANEPIRSRVAPLAYNLARTGSDQYAITSEDPESLAEKFAGIFDFVLVDAPCSGQALMARGKQSAGAVQSAQIELNARRQNRILRAAVQLLRPGGRLVYSTCTFAIEENEAQVRFLVDELAMQPSPVQRLANYQTEIRSAPSSDVVSCSYRLWPHRHGCAGSFAARLRRPLLDEEPNIDLDRDLAEDSWRRSTTSRSRDESMVPSDATYQLPFLIRPDDSNHRWQLRDWIIDAHTADAPDWVAEPFVIGPEVAHRTGSTWKPSHAASLRRGELTADVPAIEVDDEVAELYLSGQTIPAGGSSGWQIVRHAGRALGWIKSDGRIGKNHLARFART